MPDFVKIDIKGGQMTFAQRDGLGRFLSDSTIDDLTRYQKVMKYLHPDIELSASFLKKHDIFKYYQSIREGIDYWCKMESTNLKHSPSKEEIQAGSSELSKKLGHMGTAEALATRFSTTPHDVLTWSYQQVYNYLYIDLEKHKYSEKVRKIHEQKAKSKRKR